MSEEIKRGPGRPKKIVDPTEIDNDKALLTASDIAEIEAEVEAEAQDELREQAKKNVKANLRAEARLKKGLEEQQEEVIIDLAPYADRLLINNRAFLQGQAYTVPHSLACVLREQMQRTWGHQSEIDGKSENFYRKARSPKVTPNGVVNTSQLLRA